MQQLPTSIPEMVLAIDIGTSGCRAALFDNKGEVINSSESTYSYSTYGLSGYAEQDPEQILLAFFNVIIKASANYSESITHVVIDSVLHSLVLVDKAGIPLTPLSIWADTRAQRQCATLCEFFTQHQWHEKTGCPLSATYPLARLLWYKENLPLLFARFGKALSIKSFIWYRIFGVFVEDHSLASASGLFNLQKSMWDDDVLGYLGLDASRLPDPVPVEYQLAGSDMQPDLPIGLPQQAAWVIGGGDGPMAHLATVGYRSDAVSITLGTSSAVRMLSKADDAGRRPDVWTYMLEKQHYISGIASNNGGNVLDWYLHNVLKTTVDWDAIDLQLDSCGFDKELYFFPYLFEERIFPGTRDLSSGLLGIRADHTSLDIIRAILEGIVFHAVHMCKRLVGSRTVNVIALSGSLSRLGFVREAFAGLLNTSIQIVPVLHAPQAGSFTMLTGKIVTSGMDVVAKETGDNYGDKYLTWQELLESPSRSGRIHGGCIG